MAQPGAAKASPLASRREVHGRVQASVNGRTVTRPLQQICRLSLVQCANNCLWLIAILRTFSQWRNSQGAAALDFVPCSGLAA